MMAAFDVQSIFICPYCNNTYDSPVVLPCYETICKKHLSELNQKSVNDPTVVSTNLTDEERKCNEIIKCPFCTEVHRIPTAGFQEDKRVKRLLQLNLDKLDLGEKHHGVKSICDSFERELSTLQNLNQNPLVFLREYFSKMQKEVRERRDELIDYISKYYDSMSENLKQFEVECSSAVHSNQMSNDEINALRKKLEDWKFYLNLPVVDEKKWERIKAEVDAVRSETKRKSSYLKDALMLHKECKFEGVNFKQVDLQSLGQLSIHLSYLKEEEELAQYVDGIGLCLWFSCLFHVSIHSSWASKMKKYKLIKYDEIIEDIEQERPGATEKLREILEKQVGMSKSVVDILIRNSTASNWPKCLQTKEKRSANCKTIKDLVYRRIR